MSKLEKELVDIFTDEGLSGVYTKGVKDGILDCGHRLLRILSKNLIYPKDMPMYSPLLTMDVVCMAVEQIYKEEKLIEENTNDRGRSKNR